MVIVVTILIGLIIWIVLISLKKDIVRYNKFNDTYYRTFTKGDALLLFLPMLIPFINIIFGIIVFCTIFLGIDTYNKNDLQYNQNYKTSIDPSNYISKLIIKIAKYLDEPF